MKRRVSLACLAVLGAAGLSACKHSPSMIDIQQVLPPGLLAESFNHTFPGAVLGRGAMSLWIEFCPDKAKQGIWCSESIGQIRQFTAPAKVDMHQVIDFYQKQLGDGPWLLRRYSRKESNLLYDCAVWQWEQQALQTCWTKDPVEWQLLSSEANKQEPVREKLRLILVYATPRPT